jgi:hypothetical protein
MTVVALFIPAIVDIEKNKHAPAALGSAEPAA